MGALVAAITKTGENVVPKVVTMLTELEHRGRACHGVATPDSLSSATKLEELEFAKLHSNIALGYNLSAVLPRDKPQPVIGDSFSVIFEGRLYPSPEPPELSEVDVAIDLLASNPLKKAGYILEKMFGSYAFALAESDRLIVGRERFGTTPLYYGENQILCAVASERKALWKLGLDNVQSFPPGKLSIITNQGFSFRITKPLWFPPKEKIDMETAANALELLLLESIRKQLSDVEKVAIAFSGGVDSTVVAALAKTVGIDIRLISVGLENQPEIMFARKVADTLELPIHIQTYEVADLESTLEKVLWLTEENNPVNACIAVPFYWLAETARKLGCPVLLAGQGGDELFGGYHRYLTEYAERGAENVEETMFKDIVNANNTNFQRDNHVCSYYGVELRLPFIDWDVIDFVFRLPFRLKINSVEDKLRKRVLRLVAKKLDVPSFLADKQKKAIQYTTGVTKALQQKARNEDLTLQKYINKIFLKVYPNRKS